MMTIRFNRAVITASVFVTAATIIYGSAIGTRFQFAHSGQPSEYTPLIAAQPTPEPLYKILTEDDLRQAFKDIPSSPPTNKTIVSEKKYSVAVATLNRRDGKPEQHLNSDRIFLIKSGSVKMYIGGTITDRQETAPGEIRSKTGTGYKDYDKIMLRRGAVLSVPGGIPYQLIAKNTKVTFMVIRIL